MIRAASLRGFVPLVTELGGDPAALLDRFGIPATVLASDDALVSITAHDLMLDTAARELRCPDLGLRLAGAQDITILGPLAVAIESSSTVAEAIDCVSRFMFVHSPALTVRIDDDPLGVPGMIAVTYRKDLRESPYSPQATELGLGLMYRIADALIGLRPGLSSVQLPHRPISPVARYVETFGVDVRFGRAPAALRGGRQLLDRRFRNANQAIRALAVAHLARTYRDPGVTVTARVRAALADRLGVASPDLESIARLLDMHPRTLQRRLAAEGASFAAVLDDVRRDAAYRYLTTTELPLNQIAALLGLSEQSTLTRAVRRWHARSPRELRRAESVVRGG